MGLIMDLIDAAEIRHYEKLSERAYAESEHYRIEAEIAREAKKAAAGDEKERSACVQLAEDLREYLQDFMEKKRKSNIWEPSGDGIMEVDASAYGSGSYDYPTKAKARLACREALRSAIASAKENFKAEKNAVMEQTAELFADMENELMCFAVEFGEAFADYVSLDLGEDRAMQKRIREAGKAEFSKEMMEAELEALDIGTRFAHLMKKSFEESAAGIFKESAYTELCSWDEEDGAYCFEIDSAVDELNIKMTGVFEDACDGFGDKLRDLYLFAVGDFCDRLWKKVSSILRENGNCSAAEYSDIQKAPKGVTEKRAKAGRRTLEAQQERERLLADGATEEELDGLEKAACILSGFVDDMASGKTWDHDYDVEDLVKRYE